ncbi:hypothetical protein C5167_014348 [Papaver somniferum]|uniref:Uncharacterized protein n=1 Tax=Papaver somniferum TaxID=3469 RepID=A0A4Y7J2X5_PAPSO|nr:uncharacterized protein LOC113361657 [Papaver somniferum]RZC55493.1 hypothetical protein C5167_014348 [Papaver somniferum]
MKEVMKNCIVRKKEGSTAIRINEANEMLRKKGSETPTVNPSPYRMPHQLMIIPAIPLKTHPPPAREIHRVTEEGVCMRRKSLVVKNMTYKMQQEPKDRAKNEQKEVTNKTIQMNKEKSKGVGPASAQ